MSFGYEMAREAVQLDAMDVAEVDDILLDFTTNVKPGEAITSVLITVEVERGLPDANAASMASGPHAVGVIDASDTFIPDASGFVILQRLDATGRVPRTTYCVRCVVMLTGGRALAIACHVPVRRL